MTVPSGKGSRLGGLKVLLVVVLWARRDSWQLWACPGLHGDKGEVGAAAVVPLPGAQLLFLHSHTHLQGEPCLELAACWGLPWP